MSNIFTRKTKRLVPGMAYQIDPSAQVLAIDQINTEDISLDRGRMTATAIVSTPAVDRDGDIVEQHGLEWIEYQRNPVVFFNHKVNDLPVGRSEDDEGQSTIVVADECTIATCFFNQHIPFAHQIFSLVDDKTLRGTSLGFLVKLAVPVVGAGANMAFARITQGQLDKPRGYRIKSAIVTEWSWVGIGCNPEAVLMHLTKGLIGGEPIGPSLREALEPFAAARLVMASPGGEIIEKVFDTHGRLHGGDPINLGRFSNKPKEPKKGSPKGKKAGGLASGDIRDKIYEDLKKRGRRISSQMYDIQPKWLTFPIRRKLQSDDDQRHSWGGPPAETARFLLREKWEITGNMKDAGYILQDKLEDGKLEEKEEVPEKKEAPEKKEVHDKKDNYLDTHLMTRIIHYLRHNPHQSAGEIRHALKEDGGFDGHISEHPVHLAITKLISDGTVVDEHAGKKGGMSLFSLSKMYLEKSHHDTEEGPPSAKAELTGKEVNDLASSSGDEETDKRRGGGLPSVQSYLSKVLAADKKVTAHRISLTQDSYVDVSWKSEPNYNPAEIVLAACQVAKGKQDDLFVSKKLGFYQIINKSRPGIEVVFEASVDIKKVQKILDKFTKKGLDGFAVEIHLGDDAGNNKGLRIQYVPEVEMRWDTNVRDCFSGENGEAELKKELRKKRKVLLQILKELDTIKGIEAASLNKYDTLVIGKENHGNYDLGRGVGGVSRGLYGSFWEIGGTHSRIQEAARRLNEGEGRDDPYAGGGALVHRDGAKSAPKKGSKKGFGGFEEHGGGGKRPLLSGGSANRGGEAGEGSSRSRFVTYHGTGNKSAHNAGGAGPSPMPRGQGVPVSDGIYGSATGLAAPSRIGPLAHHESLEGLPRKVRIEGAGTITAGPHSAARFAAAEHARLAGLIHEPPQRYARVDKDRAKHIADAYEEMRGDASSTPKGKMAYSALTMETLDQYLTAKKHGLVCEFLQSGQEDPYRLSARLMIEDIKDNHHLWVVPSVPSGTLVVISPEELAKNPMLGDSGEKFGEAPATFDDLFRVVHDYFGHAKEGVGFRSDGQENAWRSHAALFSPKARHAMTTRTRGLNSWLYSGPRGKDHSTGSKPVTVFPPYKTGLLPDWVVKEGHGDHEVHSPPLRIPAHLTDAQRLQIPMKKMLAAYYSGGPWVMTKNAEFESKHKRGGAKNAGQFSKQAGTGKKKEEEKDKPSILTDDDNEPVLDISDPKFPKLAAKEEEELDSFDGIEFSPEDEKQQKIELEKHRKETIENTRSFMKNVRGHKKGFPPPSLGWAVREHIEEATSKVGGMLAKLIERPENKAKWERYQRIRKDGDDEELEGVDKNLVEGRESYGGLNDSSIGKIARVAAAYDVVKHHLGLLEKHTDLKRQARQSLSEDGKLYIYANDDSKFIAEGKDVLTGNHDMELFKKSLNIISNVWKDLEKHEAKKKAGAGKKPAPKPAEAPAPSKPSPAPGKPPAPKPAPAPAPSPAPAPAGAPAPEATLESKHIRGGSKDPKPFKKKVKAEHSDPKTKAHIIAINGDIKKFYEALGAKKDGKLPRMKDHVRGRIEKMTNEMGGILAKLADSPKHKAAWDKYQETRKTASEDPYYKDWFDGNDQSLVMDGESNSFDIDPAAKVMARAAAAHDIVKHGLEFLNEGKGDPKTFDTKLFHKASHIVSNVWKDLQKHNAKKNAGKTPAPAPAPGKPQPQAPGKPPAPAPGKPQAQAPAPAEATTYGLKPNDSKKAPSGSKAPKGAAPAPAGAAPKKPSNFHSFTEKLRTHKLTPGSRVKLPDLVKSSLNGVANAVTTSLIASRKRNSSSMAEWKGMMQGNKQANSKASMKQIINGKMPKWIGSVNAKKAGGKDAKGRLLLTKPAFASLQAHATVTMARHYAAGNTLKKGDIKTYLSMTDYLRKLHGHFKKIDKDYVVQKSLEAAARTPLAAFLAQPMQRMMAAFASYNLVGLSKGLNLASCDPIVPMVSSSRMIGLPRAALLEVTVPAKLVELSSIDSSATAIDSNLFPPSTEVSKAVMAGMALCSLEDEKFDQSLLVLCAKLASGVAISKDELMSMADWFKDKKDISFNLLGGEVGREWCEEQCAIAKEDPELDKKA